MYLKYAKWLLILNILQKNLKTILLIAFRFIPVFKSNRAGEITDIWNIILA